MDRLITERITKAIKEKVFPGGVVGVVRKSGNKIILPFGYFTYNNSNAVKEDTIYDVASITKAIPTASSLLVLIDQGKIKLEDKIVDYIPEFNNHNNKKEVLVKHLLTYTLDLDVPSTSSLKDKSPDEIIEVIIKAPLKNAPGSRFLYTNSTTIFIGLLVERISGKQLDVFADEYFFRPLVMNRTTFHPERFKKEEIAPTEIDDWRGRLIQGEVHDEVTYTLQQKYILGIAGLFSTTPDLLNFLEMLLNNGTMGSRRYFSPEIVKQMYTNQISDIGENTGLGWGLNQPRFAGRYCTQHTFDKTGFTGCIVICDPIKEVGLVLLSNHIYPKRPANPDAINEVRRDIADIIFSNI